MDTRAASPTRLDDRRLEALKWFALLAMLVDHSGRVFLTGDALVFAMAIGRFAFPAFTFLVAWRLHQKPDRWLAYFPNLLAFALIAEFPHAYLFPESGVNVLFTLLLGAIACGVIETRRWLYRAGIVPILLAASLVDYGLFGVLSVVAARYLFRVGPAYAAGVLCVGAIAGLAAVAGSFVAVVFAPAVLLSGLVVVLVAEIGPRAPRTPKLVWYALYPGHLAAIAVVTMIL